MTATEGGMIWQRPLMVWAAAFAAGVGLGAVGWLPPFFAFGLAALGLGALVWGRRPALFILGVLLLGVCAGAVRLAAFQTVASDDVSRWADRPAPLTIVGTVLSDPETRRGGAVTFFLDADSVAQRRQVEAATGEVAVTLGPDAARAQSLDYGDRVRLEGTLETPSGATNPGAFSWQEFLARRAVYCELRVKRPGALDDLGASRLNPFLHVAVAVRRRVLSALRDGLPPAQAAVLGGVLIGHRADLPPELMADFVHTGTVHILASAGLHVGILAFWLEWLFQKLTLPRKAQAALTLLCLGLYVLVCGGRPAVTRAALMAALYFGAVLFEREPDGPTAIATAALFILVLQPTALLEPGFQMSFLTLLTLALAMPLWSEFWRPRLAARFRLPAARRAALWAVEGMGLSGLAQLGALPIVAASYNEISLTGWLANLIVVPALFVVIPLGFTGIVLLGLWHTAGLWLLGGVGWGVGGILAVVRGFGEASWSYRAVESPSPWLIGGIYGLILWAAAGGIGTSPRPSPPRGEGGRKGTEVSPL